MILYQSELFRDEIPEATREMMHRPYVFVRWTEAVLGDRPVPGLSNGSLATMRDAMLDEQEIVAAVFIGGMEGIRDEFERVGNAHPESPRFALTGPGGEAALLQPNDLPAFDPTIVDLYPLVLDIALIHPPAHRPA